MRHMDKILVCAGAISDCLLVLVNAMHELQVLQPKLNREVMVDT